MKKEGIHVRVILSCMFVSSDNMELPVVMGGVWVELPAMSCECA